MQISLTLELTSENLEKLKVFCEDTKAEVKKPVAKQKPASTTKTEAKPVNDEKPPFEEAPAKEEPVITMTDVRAVALKISKAGKADLLKEIFAKFDATKLSEVPADRYADLMKELAAVNA